MRIASVTLENFDDLAALMEARGGPDFCWCAAWRDKPAHVTQAKGDEGKALRKAVIKAQVDRGVHVGLLAYDGDLPVAWCSCGPLQEFKRLGGPKDEETGKVWAISCFFLNRQYRGQGVTPALTRAAIDTARKAGASYLQTNGVERDSPSYKFMGLRDRYLALGFSDIGMVGSRRHVMRLEL